METITLRAEPLSSEGWAPFGQVIGRDDVAIELRGNEVFHLDIIHYDRKPILADHINRHHEATQALVSLAGKPWVIIVGPPDLDVSSAETLRAGLRAFIGDGSLGINIGLGVWHEGPFPLMHDIDLVNVQGKHVIESDNEVAHIADDLGVVIEVAL
jgi:ureidoglycolate lyase